ncbi:hypothetical protein [Microbispora sp. NPDC049125]|uniref:hypothetical protein n=1 Tax=Microbispora sp. NPDC049125 TaxID=3154929 RepID=UPI00346557EB
MADGEGTVDVGADVCADVGFGVGVGVIVTVTVTTGSGAGAAAEARPIGVRGVTGTRLRGEAVARAMSSACLPEAVAADCVACAGSNHATKKVDSTPAKTRTAKAPRVIAPMVVAPKKGRLMMGRE